MPRRSRIRLPGYPLHILQRGNDRKACFRSDADRVLYLALLEEHSKNEKCSVHAYVLMDNHVHLLVTPWEKQSASELMRKLGQHYAQHFNKVHKRTGALWEGRFKSFVVDSEGYLLRCYRYVERNPVRAGMVRRASEYPWSSYGINAEGKDSTLVEPHPKFLGLARDGATRRAVYRQLVNEDLSPQEIEIIRAAARSGFALGSAAFIDEVERATGRRAETIRKKKGRKPSGDA
jgi:putative transposase